jgi:two-component system cell cycle sensor histidine kinase/response regulator CckA
MNRPQHSNISKRLILGFSALIIIFILFGVYTLYDIHRISQLSRHIYNHPLVVSNAALQANMSILRIHRSMKDVVLFHSLSRIQKSIEKVNDEEDRVHRQLDIVKNNILGDEGKALENEAKKLFDAWRPIRNEVIGFVHNGQRENAANITIGKGADHVALLETKMLGLLNYAKGKASEFNLETERIASRSNIIVISLLLLATLVSIFIAFTIIKRTLLIEKNLMESETQYRRLFETANDGILLLEKHELKISHANPAITAMLGYSKEDCIGNNLNDVGFPDDIGNVNEIMQTLNEDGICFLKDLPIKKKTGQVVDTDIYMVDRASLVQCNIRNITKRKRAEETIREGNEKLNSIMDNIGVGVAMISPKMEIIELNNQMREWFPSIEPGNRPICYQAFNDPPLDSICDYCPTAKTLRDGKVYEDITSTKQRGIVRNFRIVSSPITSKDGEVTAAIEMVEDITERLNLQAQLVQSQKMESVGRLAGGVAHDYNNMSSIIIGYSELALEKVEQGDPLHDDLMEILTAAKRSTDITRQLLAFARQQTIAPKVLDLNDSIESMLKMLRRLIGEDIDLAWLPGAEVWPVKIDPSQVDQIMANLCVNARDAIADVGKVTIETKNISFDEDYCADHAGFIPGEYVLLAVSDDGSGMAQETMDKVFEPFFTTKGLGKGTGLGMSTVFGIVKQNNGFINVYSEPEKGTTIKIYLSRHTGQAVEAHSENTLEIPLSRGEAVLLVEDDASILKLGKRILKNLGYNVLSSKSPGDAFQLAKDHADKIHLLITDVVMPEMNGRELSEKLQALYPNLKTLFMSGYTANVIAHRGVLEDGVSFISKPFSKKDMAFKVREILDGAKGKTHV